MTVNASQAYSGPMAANGATLVYPFTFPCQQAVDVAVVIGGTLVTAGFSVALNDAQTTNPGGQVTFTTAPGNAEYPSNLFIVSAITLAQNAAFSTGVPWNAASVNTGNAANDRGTLVDQMLARDIARAALVPLGQPGPVLDIAAMVEGQVLGLVDGQLVGVASPSTVTVTGYLLTRALAAAQTVVGAVSTIQTSGYATPGDGGGAIYMRGSGPYADGSSFQTPDGQWWQLSPKQRINVKMFGAVGDSIVGTPGTDNSTAFANAVAFVKANCWTLAGGAPINAAALIVPAGGYLITKSQDFTSASFAAPLGIVLQGEGPLSTVIFTHLTEAYPALDFTGASYSSIRDLSVRQMAGCEATAGIARLSCGTDPLGYNVMDRDLIVDMITCPGVVSTVDVYKLSNVQSQGPYGAVLGAGNGLGITSKFQATIANSDLTLLYLDSCFFTGGLPLFLTGCDAVVAVNTYCAITSGYSSPIAVDAGTANAAAIVIDATIDHIGLGHYRFLGCRTENQDSSGTRNVMHCLAVLDSNGGVGANTYDLDLDGVFENTPPSGGPQAGAVIVFTAAGASINALKISGQNGNTTSPLLRLLGPCGNTSYDIRWITSVPLGTVSSKTSSEVRLGTNFTQADFLTLGSGSGGGRLIGNFNSQISDALSDNVFSQHASAVPLQHAAGASLVSTATAYVGGSGTQVIQSVAIPANLLQISAGRPSRNLEIEIPITGNGADTYTIALQLTDGTTVVNFAAMNVAAANLSGRARFLISNISTATGQLQAHGDIMLGSQVLAAQAFGANALDWATGLQAQITISSATSAPVNAAGAVAAVLR